MQSKYNKFISCDFETGGLPNSTMRAFYDIPITEIALVSISEDLKIEKSDSWLVKPYKEGLEYSKGAEIASGISKQMVEEQGENLEEVFKKILLFFKDCKTDSRLPVIFGHNFIKFDSAFMVNMFEYFKTDITKYLNPEAEDTLKWSRFMWKESVNYKLGTCCQNAGITLQDAHRAMSDTQATAELFIYFMKNLRGENFNKKEIGTKKFRESFEI